MTVGFLPRNDPRLVRAPWPEFCAWAREAGCDESELDVNDSRCQELQEQFLEETADAATM